MSFCSAGFYSDGNGEKVCRNGIQTLIGRCTRSRVTFVSPVLDSTQMGMVKKYDETKGDMCFSCAGFNSDGNGEKVCRYGVQTLIGRGVLIFCAGSNSAWNGVQTLIGRCTGSGVTCVSPVLDSTQMGMVKKYDETVFRH
eukprot:gene13858-4801_t